MIGTVADWAQVASTLGAGGLVLWGIARWTTVVKEELKNQASKIQATVKAVKELKDSNEASHEKLHKRLDDLPCPDMKRDLGRVEGQLNGLLARHGIPIAGGGDG